MKYENIMVPVRDELESTMNKTLELYSDLGFELMTVMRRDFQDYRLFFKRPIENTND